MGHFLAADPEVQVVGTAADGEEAIRLVHRHHPDVVAMDVVMPGMNGLDATRRIMEECPVPIVIISENVSSSEVGITFQALQAGAISVLRKPKGLSEQDAERVRKEIVQPLKLMATVPVVRRRRRGRTDDQPLATHARRAADAGPVTTEFQMVAIGASTGGPPAIQTVLSALPKPFPLPIVIVQHMSTGFITGMSEWLSSSSGFAVGVAKDGDRLVPGRVYLAPDGRQMSVGWNCSIKLVDDVSPGGFCPSVAHLFGSVALNIGNKAIGVLLTGMGHDGARELKLMRDAGAVTIAQDSATSVVNGMPGEAIKLGAAAHVLPITRIADKLRELTL